MSPSTADGLRRFYDQQAPLRLERGLPEWRHELRRRFVEMVDSSRPPLLDLGAGAGPDSIGFKADGFDVLSVDLSLENARIITDQGVTAIVGNATALPFANAGFGTVWAMSSLLHVADSLLGDALDEIGRVLSPAGLVSVGCWGGIDSEGPLDSDVFDPPRFYSFRSDARFFAPLESRFETIAAETMDPKPDSENHYQWFVGRQRSGTSSV